MHGAIYKTWKRAFESNPINMENTMTATAYTTTETHDDTEYEISTFALGVGIAMAAFVGIWGATCLASAMINVGPINVIKSYFTALLG